MFDESFEVVGDYEFFLRAASKGCKFIHEPKAEGIMLWHQGALSTRDSKELKKKIYFLKNTETQKDNSNFIKKIFHQRFSIQLSIHFWIWVLGPYAIFLSLPQTLPI